MKLTQEIIRTEIICCQPRGWVLRHKGRVGERGTHGTALSLALFFAFAIFCFLTAVSVQVLLALKANRLQKNQIQCMSYSLTTFHDLELAVAYHLDLLTGVGQTLLNRKSKSGTADVAAIDGICQRIFPRYDQLELRGSTFTNKEGWQGLYGRANIAIFYNGIRPLAKYPELEAELTTAGTKDNYYPYVISLTATVPYDIQKFETPIAADGTTLEYGSAWRPARVVTTFDKFRTAPGAPIKDGYFHIPNYSATGEMKFFMILAKPTVSEPDFLIEEPVSCTASIQENGLGGYNVVGCNGGVIPGTFKDAAAAQEVVAAINGGASVSGLLQSYKENSLYSGFIVDGPIRRGQWRPVKTPSQVSGGGGSKVPVNSNINSIRVLHTKMVLLQPGKTYVFGGN
ncbi:MAG: hypothetical protein K1Y36_21795 [Blastocatellia bacterium]|nr:hypothetical protein [Blastocatellia bacterium]